MVTHRIYSVLVYVLLSYVRSDSTLSKDNFQIHGFNVRDPRIKVQRKRSHTQSYQDSGYNCGVEILDTKQFIQDFRLTCVYKGKTIDQCGSMIRSKNSYWEIPRDSSTDAKPFIQIDVSPLVDPLIEEITIHGNVRTVKILMIQNPSSKRRYSPIQGRGIFYANQTILLDEPKPNATFIKIIIMDLQNSNDTKFRINISMKCCIQEQAMAMFKCCVEHKVSTECMPMCWGIQRFIDWPLCFYLYSHIQKSCEDGSPVQKPWPWLLPDTDEGEEQKNYTGSDSTTTKSPTRSRAVTNSTHGDFTFAIYFVYSILLHMVMNKHGATL